MDIELDNGKSIRVNKELSIKEKKVLGKVIDGKMNPNSKDAQEILNRPHVAVAFEALLEKHNLSEDKMVQRLAEIIKRAPTVSISDKGLKTTNITSVDANAKDTIRMIWQAQGKFVEKHEIKGEMHHMSDDELDNIIHSGTNFLLNKGKTRLDKNDIPPADTN